MKKEGWVIVSFFLLITIGAFAADISHTPLVVGPLRSTDKVPMGRPSDNSLDGKGVAYTINMNQILSYIQNNYQGQTGTTPTIAVGSVTTGAAGSDAQFTNVGTPTAAIFDVRIPKGDKGDTGNAGATGIQGEQGLQGIQGLKGDTGEQGLQGIQGEQGLQGIQGEQGLQGIQGLKGDTGEQGLQGIQGEQGPAGADGTGNIAFDRMTSALKDNEIVSKGFITNTPNGEHMGDFSNGNVPYTGPRSKGVIFHNMTTINYCETDNNCRRIGSSSAGGASSLSELSDWPPNVSATEAGYLNGVTSSIQDQINLLVSNSGLVPTPFTDAFIRSGFAFIPASSSTQTFEDYTEGISTVSVFGNYSIALVAATSGGFTVMKSTTPFENYTATRIKLLAGTVAKITTLNSIHYVTANQDPIWVETPSEPEEPTDTTPDAFNFTDQTNVALSTLITSTGIAVAGVNSPATITVSGGLMI